MSCNSSDHPTLCSNASPELNLYQAFIFSVPVFFTFILLLLFYVCYLRRRRASWQSMRMRASNLGGEISISSNCGIKKEVREMLPVVVFKESFLIRETQCSVCLGDYQAEDRLQRIPFCGHTFHVDCIDHWLSTHTTCPLCRVSLLTSTKSSTDQQDHEVQVNEDQVQEQSQENGAEREGVCDAAESTRSGEGSVVIDIDSHRSSE
ncbi:uncharacterized protein A4U43_C02F5900 [Asparagus officinalis]|uniref:RING-type E3 ubiquitin transferase n=1 Tax=Asparagus officinalis TaxID=4686 RepID=A0A5P1FG91_ASPOF|nr:RING-H2 finger protein ATL58-like [Asparagus officinalis]ONK77378.1 uncharacterized protein A4U43_C02F5900 [Asparagus officinalis]